MSQHSFCSKKNFKKELIKNNLRRDEDLVTKRGLINKETKGQKQEWINAGNNK
jgi:hypothetical protein